MKLDREKNSYMLPMHSSIQFVALDVGQIRHSLYRVSADDFFKCDVTTVGIPTSFTIVDDTILFWPTPDDAYNVVIRYAPPVKEC